MVVQIGLVGRPLQSARLSSWPLIHTDRQAKQSSSSLHQLSCVLGEYHLTSKRYCKVLPAAGTTACWVSSQVNIANASCRAHLGGRLRMVMCDDVDVCRLPGTLPCCMLRMVSESTLSTQAMSSQMCMVRTLLLRGVFPLLNIVLAATEYFYCCKSWFMTLDRMPVGSCLSDCYGTDFSPSMHSMLWWNSHAFKMLIDSIMQGCRLFHPGAF